MNDTIVFIFVLIIIFLVFLNTYLKPQIKGIIGESQVSRALRKLGKDYIVINNVKLNTKGAVSQIDHIVVSNYGIFVIETKNYKGWILGNENSQNWTQVIYKYKNRFYNPVLQNRGHIYALKHLLKEYRNLEFISIVVFTNKASLKTQNKTHVIKLNKLLSTIYTFEEIQIGEHSKQQIATKIFSDNLNNKKNRIIEETKYSVPEIKCPECNGVLIERSGKFGKFFGCTNYPICKFTQN